jgi:hypothetical protein
MKINIYKIEKITFYTLLALALSIIIIPKFYLTGDGPSHTYNAKVLADYLLNNNRDFYKPFYEINRNLDPNWTSQILLAIFTKIFPYWLADKVFQIIYVCVFAFGFRYLIKSLNKTTNLLTLFFYPFCFTLPFQLGYYNYSLGLGLLFFLFTFYMQNRKQLSSFNQLGILIGSFILVFTHAMAATHFLMLCALVIIQDAIHLYKEKKNIKTIFENLIPNIIIFTPIVLVIIGFTMRQGLATTPHALTVIQKIFNFLCLYCCQSTLIVEKIPAICFGIGILFFACIIIIKGNCNNKITRNTFLLFTIYTLLAYLNAPGTVAYNGIDIRLAFLPPLFFVLALSTYEINSKINIAILFFAGIIQISFLALRFSTVLNVSNEIENILSISKNIDTKKNVLAIQYNTHGSLHQFELDNSFLHIFDYIGAMKNKQLIILNNYEADLNYFGVQWRAGKNPRLAMPNIILGKAPTPTELNNYKSIAAIDYIILQNKMQTNAVATDNDYLQLQTYLQSNYSKTDSIQSLQLELWKANSPKLSK